MEKLILLKLACGSTKIPPTLTDAKKKREILVIEKLEKENKCKKCALKAQGKLLSGNTDSQ